MEKLKKEIQIEAWVNSDDLSNESLKGIADLVKDIAIEFAHQINMMGVEESVVITKTDLSYLFSQFINQYKK